MNIYRKLKTEIILLLYRIAYKIKPRLASDIMYQRAFHKKQNLNNPKNLIEKINWLQYNSDTSMWTKCADKYRMREYIKECGLENNLPILYGHWDNPEDIDFDSLPHEFVLKSNNGCGTVKIVKDKSVIDKSETIRLLKKWLKPYGYVGGQTHYLRIRPCIIAEQLLHQDSKEKEFSPNSLVDYKMWCINGEPESIWVAYNRHDAFFVNMALYDREWNPIPQYLRNTNLETYNPKDIIPKPSCLEEMLEIARILSKPFPELRLDFYVIDGKPYIGELTFTSGYGFYTEEYYDYLGHKMDISKVPVVKK